MNRRNFLQALGIGSSASALSACGLDDKGARGVGHDKAVMVSEVSIFIAAAAALPVPSQEPQDLIDGLSGSAGAL